MNNVKFCRSCGVIISRIDDADWYSHISIKYCPKCRENSDREKTAERLKAFRSRKKAENKLRKEQLELLKEENELLRQRIIRLREEKMNY